MIYCKPGKPPVQEIGLTERNLVKEYAFCKCLQHASPDSNFMENDISVGIYAEIGGYDFEALSSIDSLAKIAAADIKPSILGYHEGKKPVLLECFEFFRSARLDSLIATKKYQDPLDWDN